MLHWFAGQKPHEGPIDPDATGYIEPPETPAPVFAVRAFKHAIFGTPQTQQVKPRRSSNTENARPRNVEPKPSRPGITRPKSAGDAYALANPILMPIEEPLSSPTKGILLSPGTAAARKKNVTFGENVVDNEEKRPLKSGFPDDCPGQFPSPWDDLPNDAQQRDETPDKGKGLSKLTEALEQARDDSRKRKSRHDKRKKYMNDDDEIAAEHAEPRSEDGKYWKREYDIYRTNTTREVKKIITKQTAAKSFAAMKDAQCTDLADQLRQEQKKVEKLEAKTVELALLIKSLQDELLASQGTVKSANAEADSSKRRPVVKDSVQRGSSHDSTIAPLHRRDSEQKIELAHKRSIESSPQRPPLTQKYSASQMKPQGDTVQRPSEPYSASAVSEKAKADARSHRSRSKPKSDEVQLKSTDDIWAQLDRSSSPVATRVADKPPVSTSGARAVTSGTDATPLKTLNVNTLPTDADAKRADSPQSMDVECKSTPDLDRVDSKTSSGDEKPRHESPLHSPILPLLPSEMSQSEIRPNAKRKKSDSAHDDHPIVDSSPFLPSAKTFHSKPLPSVPRTAPEAASASSLNSKENISPDSKAEHELKVKPSVMWSSINAAPAGKRNTSMTGKDGKQMSLDRIEAARARIAARGRVTS